MMSAATFLHAQDKKKVAELDIRTSTVCDMCVKTIEENMIYEKGVKAVRVDLRRIRSTWSTTRRRTRRKDCA